MKKLLFTLALVAMSALAFTAEAGNSFNVGLHTYTVAHTRMMTVTPNAFQTMYDDGNVSDVYSDPGNAKATALRTNAPAMASYIQVGQNSGIYVNKDEIKEFHCQVGTGVQEAPATTGSYMFIAWYKVGYAVLPDPGCATVAALRGAAN